MNPAAWKYSVCRICAIIFILLLGVLPGAVSRAADTPAIFPLDQIKPGMKGVAYTIFEGDQIEKFDLEVIGLLPNMMGPKQSIILVQLLGPKVEHTGVVAGMSGSPVYIDGKLAGAISLKIGTFSKEAIAGVTPIEDMLSLPPDKGNSGVVVASGSATGAQATANLPVETAAGGGVAMPHYSLPKEWDKVVGGAGNFLEPIASPLTFAGFSPQTIRQYAPEFQPYGMVAVAGGSGTPEPDDAKIVPGDMVSMVLVGGDLSVEAACTVTTVIEDRVYACGHPLFDFGDSRMPLARGRVVTTLASEFESTKVVSSGGMIGTLTQDRLTAVMGRLGAVPPMIPVDLTVKTPDGERQFHLQVLSDPKLTPALIGLASFNGLTQNTAYGEGNTLKLSGTIDIQGHEPVSLEDMYAPTDNFQPDGTVVATSVQQVFQRIFANPYETPAISRVTLSVESVPERRVGVIENAWSETSEANPGDNVTVKVMLRPYRGAPAIVDMPILIPEQAAHGSTVRVQVSDSDSLNRLPNLLAAQGKLGGLDQLITLLNRSRRNNRLYVTLFKPTPTLLMEEKELPNAPLSEINVLNQRRVSGNSALLRESEDGQWSKPMDEVISGSASVYIKVK